MPDTSAARAAIKMARDENGTVDGRLTVADIWLQAAAEAVPLRHAAEAIDHALAACAQVGRGLLIAAQEIAKLRKDTDDGLRG